VTPRIDADGARTAVEVTSTEPTFSAIGVRLDRLRAGLPDEPLFIVPGLAGDPGELTGLVSAFTGPQEVYAVAPVRQVPESETAMTMESIAEQLVAAIRQHQPSGPYRLGGYSFGGLLALEMAQQLHAVGEVVQPLFLIEAIYDERYWDRGIWLRALLRRTARHLLRIARMRPPQAVAELRLRGVRLIQRVLRRSTDAPIPLQTRTSDIGFSRCALSALAGYRPRFYDGTITLIASSVDRHFGCDTAQLWSGYAHHLDSYGVMGDHVSVMHDPVSTRAIASVIDHRLALTRTTWAGLRPVPGFARPMILTTMRWFSAARLAHALVEAGFSVSACRPRAHALDLVEGLTSDCRLAGLRQLRSLATAIRRAEPDIVLPGDERALVLLRRLHARTRTTDPEMAALIAHSLGSVEVWPSIVSRTALADEARTLNISAPATEVIGNSDALTDWVTRHNLPILLKTDGSFGGRGVAIVREASHFPRAWRALSNPPKLSRAIKRLMVNHERAPLEAWVHQLKPTVNAQQFVTGREAIATVACVGGETSALVCLEVVQTSLVKGPASVVRVIDHPRMAEAARRLVRRFGLSGFCGFDFIISETGDAHLLELNPRLTPTAHLLVEGNLQRPETLVLFPAEPGLGRESGTAVSGVLDVPMRAPALISLGERITARGDRRLTRIAHQLQRKLTAVPY
jgi:thioesterase domain-containing protein